MLELAKMLQGIRRQWASGVRPSPPAPLPPRHKQGSLVSCQQGSSTSSGCWGRRLRLWWMIRAWLLELQGVGSVILVQIGTIWLSYGSLAAMQRTFAWHVHAPELSNGALGRNS